MIIRGVNGRIARLARTRSASTQTGPICSIDASGRISSSGEAVITDQLRDRQRRAHRNASSRRTRKPGWASKHLRRSIRVVPPSSWMSNVDRMSEATRLTALRSFDARFLLTVVEPSSAGSKALPCPWRLSCPVRLVELCSDHDRFAPLRPAVLVGVPQGVGTAAILLLIELLALRDLDHVGSAATLAPIEIPVA